MGVVLEPLDRRAHKRCLIGPSADAAALADRVRGSCSNLSLCWDSSHMLLEGEDLETSLATMGPYVTHLHLANPVLDRSREDFGDRHARFAPGGDLSVAAAGRVLHRAAALSATAGVRWSAAAEVCTPDGGNPWDTVRHCEAVLREAWSAAAESRRA
jgi:sugar phosphate isomerase/epimerase